MHKFLIYNENRGLSEIRPRRGPGLLYSSPSSAAQSTAASHQIDASADGLASDLFDEGVSGIGDEGVGGLDFANFHRCC